MFCLFNKSYHKAKIKAPAMHEFSDGNCDQHHASRCVHVSTCGGLFPGKSWKRCCLFHNYYVVLVFVQRSGVDGHMSCLLWPAAAEGRRWFIIRWNERGCLDRLSLCPPTLLSPSLSLLLLYASVICWLWIAAASLCFDTVLANCR